MNMIIGNGHLLQFNLVNSVLYEQISKIYIYMFLHCNIICKITLVTGLLLHV